MRRLSLNLLTCSVTTALLVALALPGQADPRRRPRVGGRRAPVADARASTPRRAFGVYVDPWHVDDWARNVGAAPQLVAKFEAFSRRPDDRPLPRETERSGIRRVMVSWEPWRRCRRRFGTERAAAPQPGYRNVDIARGAQDPYIRRFARSLARFRGTVYLRYGARDERLLVPVEPRCARPTCAPGGASSASSTVAGARNVRFVWSVNPNLYETPAGLAAQPAPRTGRAAATSTPSARR